MTRAELVAIVAAEHQRAHDAIDAAYWTFSRTARGAPPPCTVPWAYDVRNEMARRLRALRRKDSALSSACVKRPATVDGNA